MRLPDETITQLAVTEGCSVATVRAVERVIRQAVEAGAGHVLGAVERAANDKLFLPVEALELLAAAREAARTVEV